MKTLLKQMARTVCVLALLVPSLARAAGESLCAVVKIEIVQQLTLERQAFDARMKINNGLQNAALEDVSVQVNFVNATGAVVLASSDPSNTNALFFIRLDQMSGIADVAGHGIVAPSTSAEIHWLIIPAQGAGGQTAAGVRYLVGATLSYKLSGESHVMEVVPDDIFVKPMPSLTLDYFLPRDVYGDDAFTQPVEPPVPFPLGVRIGNGGPGSARAVKIESAQPRIVENLQGLLIGFRITGSTVNDAPATPSLLANFGDIPALAAGMAQWTMECTLSGRFTEFSATFTHADELGGELTSLIEDVVTHELVHVVRCDAAGRDAVTDFLAKDAGGFKVYESDSLDTPVTDLSATASLAVLSSLGSRTVYRISVPAATGPVYVSRPYQDTASLRLGGAVRDDGKRLPAENVWFTKTRESGNSPWQYGFCLFDMEGGHTYEVSVEDVAVQSMPPVLAHIGDKVTFAGNPSGMGFLVEASDPNRTIPDLGIQPLPAGAEFTTRTNGLLVEGTFFWRPQAGQEGVYPVRFTASDGELRDTEIIRIYVGRQGEGTNNAGIPLSLAGHAPDVFVSARGSHQWPYATWNTAATNLEAAVDCGLDPARVWVTNGSYELGSELVITGAMSIVGVEGAAQTLVKGCGTARCVSVLRLGVQLSGLTISDGVAERGAGVYMPVGGILEDCVVVNNQASREGGGVYADGGALVRNCLVTDNRAGDGGGVYLAVTSRVESCTIAGNSSTNAGGLRVGTSGRVLNTILAGNSASNGVHQFMGSGAVVAYSCIQGLAVAGVSNLNVNPVFVNTATHDYRLRGLSPCRNAGANAAWMTSGADLAGFARIVDGTVDMGAFECRDRYIGITAGLNGSVEPGNCVWVAWGGSTSVVVTAAEHYHVADVKVDGVSVGAVPSYTFSNVTTNHTIQALFAIDRLSLAVTSAYGVPVPAGVSTSDWNTAISASLSGSPAAGAAGAQYLCTGWKGTGSAPALGASTNVSFNLTQSSTLAWQWKTQYLFSATAGPNGTVSSTNGWYDKAQSVSAKAIPATGYHFTGWTGTTASVVNPLVVTMDKAYSESATFAINLYPIVASAGANGSISPFGTVQIAHGESQIYTITPAPHYHVVDVRVDGVSVGSVTSYTFGSVTQAHTIATTFAIDPSQSGTVQLGAASASVDENAGTVTVTVTRLNGNDGAASVNFATGDGTATAGSDYTARSGTLNWAAGDSAAKTFSVPVLDDSRHEGNETFTVTLSGATGAALGTPAQATVTITDNDPAQRGTVQLSAAAYSIAENGGVVTIAVTRRSGTDGAASVNYATANGTAAAGSDYTAASGTLNWATGDGADKTLVVALLNDATREGNETFGVTLSGATGAALGTPAQAVATILDDETPQPGTLQFGAAAYSRAENGGTVTITVTRQGGSHGAASVGYMTFNGTATAGADYTAKSGMLNWAANDSVAKTFTVPILNDSAYEGDETFVLKLGVVAGATLSTPSQTTVTITDDEAPQTGYVKLNATAYSTTEGAGAVAITVVRQNGSYGAASVNYATADGTATAGSDYTAANGTLNWAANDSAAKTFTVAILDDADAEALEIFTVSLSGVTGAALGTPEQATVSIVMSDQPIVGDILVQKLGTGQTGVLPVDAGGVAGAFEQWASSLPGWSARDFCEDGVMMQQGDGGTVKLVPLDMEGRPVVSGARTLTTPIPSLIASSIDGPRVLAQLGAGGPAFIAEFDANWVMTRLVRINRSTGGLILRGLDGDNILVQAISGAGYVWRLGANGTVTSSSMVYNGAVPGAILRSIKGDRVMAQLGESGPGFLVTFDVNWEMLSLLPIDGVPPGMSLKALE